MVNSLSDKSHEKLRNLAKTLVAAFAYDNFDMDFKSWMPVVDKSGQTLKHATSALAFPLHHDVTPDDLKCSAELWRSDPMNPRIPVSERRPQHIWIDCLLPPDSNPLPGPSRKLHVIAWHFRHALVTFCEPFHHFRSELGMPEEVNQIPVEKTTYIPCRSMDINQSTNDGQGQIIHNVMGQANLGDPTDYPGVEDICEMVTLFHGDLRTGKLIEGIKYSCCIESKEIRQLQMVVFVMGLFHLQVACADALWRMFIEPKEVCNDDNSLYQQACKIHPHDLGRIGSGPGFRIMHDLAHQCAYARMLDCWHVDAKKHNSLHTLLKEFATSKPTWEQLEDISLSLAETYIDQPNSKDQDFCNNTLILGWLIQYIELTHAMKFGDIGRVENTFLHWVFVFKCVGKHKYATHLIKVMNDMKYTFPECLRYVAIPPA
jgi:hypothetical protein